MFVLIEKFFLCKDEGLVRRVDVMRMMLVYSFVVLLCVGVLPHGLHTTLWALLLITFFI